MAAVSEKKSISRDVIWNTIGTFAYMFGLWLISILTTRLLGYENAGVFSLCLVASNIATSFGSYYIRVYYASDVENRFSDSDYLFCRAFTTLVSVVVVVAYSFALRYSLQVIGSICLFYVYKIFELFTEIHSGAFQRHGKMYISGILNAAKGACSLGAFFLAAYLSRNLNIGLLAMIAVGLIIYVLELLFMKKSVSVAIRFSEINVKHIGKLLLVCLPLFLVLLCSNVLPSIPKAMFERMYSTEVFGYYSSIATISVLIQTAASSILLPIIPKIASAFLKKDFSAFWKWNAGIFAFTLALSGIAFVMVLFLGDWALKLVFGEEILQYSSTFKWTILAGACTALFVIGNQILIAMGDKIGVIVGSAVGTLVCLAISYPFCKYAFMDGISYALIIATLVEVAIFVAFALIAVKKKKREPSAKQIGSSSEK